MSYDILARELKEGRIRGLYLFYGPEDYLISYREKEIEKLVVEPMAGTVSYSLFEGTHSPEEVGEACAAFPMLGERRLVVLRKPGIFASAAKSGGAAGRRAKKRPESADKATGTAGRGGGGAGRGRAARPEPLTYETVLGGLPEHTCLLIIEDEVDKRTALYKLVAEKGLAAEFSYRTPAELEEWVKTIAAKEGKLFTRTAVALFMENAGESMTQIRNELDKLLMYTADRPGITREDVANVCASSLRARIFDLTDYVAGGQRVKAMAELEALLAAREPPPRVMSVLSGHFILLRQLKRLSARGMRQNEIIKFTGLHPYRAEKLIRQGARLSESRLTRAVELCHAQDMAIKTGRLDDTLALELLVATI